jgi:hypothetical protein
MALHKCHSTFVLVIVIVLFLSGVDSQSSLPDSEQWHIDEAWVGYTSVSGSCKYAAYNLLEPQAQSSMQGRPYGVQLGITSSPLYHTYSATPLIIRPIII